MLGPECREKRRERLLAWGFFGGESWRERGLAECLRKRGRLLFSDLLPWLTELFGTRGRSCARPRDEGVGKLPIGQHALWRLPWSQAAPDFDNRMRVVVVLDSTWC